MCFPLYGEETEFASKIESHICIKDYLSALTLAKEAVSLYPHSLFLQRLLIKTLASNHEIDQALLLFQRLHEQFETKNTQLLTTLESICWGILDEPQDRFEHLKLIHLMGAASARDFKSVKTLLASLKSTNALIRAQALRLAPMFPDDIIKEQILQMIRGEKNWFVRLGLISAIGGLKINEAKTWLQSLIEDPRTTQEEKVSAIQSLVEMHQSFSKEEFNLLIKSPRAGIRELAFVLAIHFSGKDLIIDGTKAFQDPSPYVRVMATIAFAMLYEYEYPQGVQRELSELMKDRHPLVSLTAAFALARTSPELAQPLFQDKLSDYRPEVRHLAASMVGRAARLFPKTVGKELVSHKDEFVRLNLALGSMGHALFLKEAGEVIHRALLQADEIMMDEYTHPLFPFVHQGQVRHLPHIPDHPKLVDGLTRIDLIRRLFILGHAEAFPHLKRFLSHQVWSLTFESAAILIQEGDFSMMEPLERLTKDKDAKVRVQAALALAFISKDESMVPILIEAYPKLDGNVRLMMLEALGHIGTIDAIEFLLERLKDPFHLTKVVAASSIVNSIYH